MVNYGSDNSDVLVLGDEEGNMYAIPRQVVEQHRLTEQQKAQLESELGEDVSGYTMYQQFMNQQIAAQRQVESRHTATEARMARQASSEENAKTSEAGVAGAGRLGAMVTGVWRSLTFSKPASPNA